MADCAAIKTRLDAAQAALDALQRGAAIREVQDADGSRVMYTPASLPALISRVAVLQAQYDACIAGTATVVTRPVNFFF
jgi:hypothetical protein